VTLLALGAVALAVVCCAGVPLLIAALGGLTLVAVVGIGAGVLVLALGLALCFVTSVFVEGHSCGAFDSGPDTDAQKAFCHGPWDNLAGLVPAVPLVAGAILGARRRAPAPVALGVVLAVVAAFVTVAVVP
jgi:hypothetical protein